MGIAFALLPRAAAGADAEGLINKELAFRDVILQQAAPRPLLSMIQQGDVTVTFVNDLRDYLKENVVDFEYYAPSEE